MPPTISMFIAHLKNGQHYIEDDETNTWDNLPNVGITSLQLVLPFMVKTIKDGESIALPPSTITFSGYTRYYCMNEAIALAMTNEAGTFTAGEAKGHKVAQIVGAIDDEKGVILEVRMDNQGNVRNTIRSLEEFESTFINLETRQGSFDQTCIKKGR